MLRERGSINVLLIPVILLSLLVIGAGVFGYWAFSGRQDYKNNVDQKVSSAVTDALKAEDAKKDAQFFQDAKKPLKTYSGPSAYGSVQVSYPKTWSAYVDESDTGASDVNGYFQPSFVPSVNNIANSYALRVEVVNQSYATVLKGFATYVTLKKSTVTPYSLPLVKNVVGSRVDGTVAQSKTGSMVLLPLRDKTLEIWTESSQFMDDFNNNILPNVTFSP